VPGFGLDDRLENLGRRDGITGIEENHSPPVLVEEVVHTAHVTRQARRFELIVMVALR